ncbi:MAG: hypothetical protein M1834_006200 [Cirrosporium novae-zelandiae]|nr:MAG: hypothetical protein M1834_006200 [Cirrosporium novae-zelandiae]
MDPSKAFVEWRHDRAGLCLVRLSENNKQKLFHRAMQASQSRISKSKTVIENLRKLNPGLAGQFEMRSSATARAPFRLLCSTHSRVAQDAFAEVESYVSISYCWHNDTWEPIPLCQKEDWPISDIMMRMVKRHLQSENEGIWIDQICIHQENQVEKIRAIASMDLIYKSARQVLILLEDLNLLEKDKEDIDALRKYTFRSFEAPEGSEPSGTNPGLVAGILLKFWSSRWFSRAWGAYEYKIGRYLSGQEMPVIFAVINNEDVTANEILSISINVLHVGASVQRIIFDRQILPSINRNRQEALYLQSQFFMDPPNLSSRNSTKLFSLVCTVLTDYLAILLNSSDLDLYYTGTVNSADECRWVLDSLGLAAGDVSVLTSIGHQLLLDLNGVLVPSWRYAISSLDFIHHCTLPANNHIDKISEQSIGLDLLILEKPFSVPTWDHKERARRFVECCMSKRVPTCKSWISFEHWDEYRNHFTDIPAMYTSTIDALSEALAKQVTAIVELGIDWMRKAWYIVDRELIGKEGGKWLFKSGDIELWEPARNILFKDLISEEALTLYQQEIVNLLSFLLHHDVLNEINDARVIPTSAAGDFAVINIVWLKGDLAKGNKYTLAIPVALAGQAYQRSHRVWILEDYDRPPPAPTIASSTTISASTSTLASTLSYYNISPTRTRNTIPNSSNPHSHALGSTLQPMEVIIEEDEANGTKVAEKDNLQGSKVLPDKEESQSSEEEPPSRRWRIVGKAVLWGCPTLYWDGEVVTLHEHQSVYG